MKFRLAAGAEIDVLTAAEMRKELDGALTGFSAALAQGDVYRRFTMTAQVTAGGVLSIDAPDVLGPPVGFIWSVKRLALFGLADTESAALYINDANPSAGVIPSITRDDTIGLVPYVDFDENQLVLMPGDSLVVAGTGLTAAAYVTAVGQARELPRSLLWRL